MSSYGQHAPSSSFQQDSALVAQYASQVYSERDPRSCSHSDVPEEIAAWNDTTLYESRPKRLTIGLPVHKTEPPNSPDERSPLLRKPSVSRIDESHESVDDRLSHDFDYKRLVFDEVKTLARYTLPVFGTHILEYSLLVAGTVSIGHLSTTALAAATLASMTASVTGFSIMQGFLSSLDTLLPSAWTSSNPRLVGLWCQRVSVVLFILLFPISALWIWSESILLALKQDPQVARYAATYLKWLLLGLPAYGFNNVARRYFQSQGLFDAPTRIIILIAPVNVALNYLLVWGPKPFGLGFIGAPIATAISFNLISICSVLYGVFLAPRTAWAPISSKAFTKIPVILKLGLAGVCQIGSEWWSWELIGLAASLLGPVVLATQSVLLVSASVTFQAPYALSIAVAVRVGNLLGQSRAKRAAAATHASFLIAFFIAMVWSAMFLIFRNHWAKLFNNDPDVINLVSSILPLVSLFQLMDGLAAVVAGILRAQGRQATGAVLNLVSYYIIGIPMGIYLAFKQGMNLSGLWIGLTIALVFTSGLGGPLVLWVDWDHEVKKVMDRMENERDLANDDQSAESA